MEPDGAVAKHIRESGEAIESGATPIVREAQGWKLHLSDRNATGYRAVWKHTDEAYGYAAKVGNVYLGLFPSAVEAAVAVAKECSGKGDPKHRPDRPRRCAEPRDFFVAEPAPPPHVLRLEAEAQSVHQQSIVRLRATRNPEPDTSTKLESINDVDCTGPRAAHSG